MARKVGSYELPGGVVLESIHEELHKWCVAVYRRPDGRRIWEVTTADYCCAIEHCEGLRFFYQAHVPDGATSVAHWTTRGSPTLGRPDAVFEQTMIIEEVASGAPAEIAQSVCELRAVS